MRLTIFLIIKYRVMQKYELKRSCLCIQAQQLAVQLQILFRVKTHAVYFFAKFNGRRNTSEYFIKKIDATSV